MDLAGGPQRAFLRR